MRAVHVANLIFLDHPDDDDDDNNNNNNLTDG
jgi:hypothetical protein